MDETQNDALDRLQQDHLRGALDADEYARLREQVLSGSMALPYEGTAASVPQGADPQTGAPLASWGRRAAAFLVDAAVFIAAIVPVIVWAASTEDPATGEIEDGPALLLGLEILFLPSLYHWLMLGIWGATLGKMALGIAVRRGEDAAPIGMARALGRVASAFLLGILTLPILLSYLWPLWDQRNQTLHDKMANTIVVRRTRASAHPPLTP
jgi:uncharacterized RDD family membrane protein YckC